MEGLTMNTPPGRFQPSSKHFQHQNLVKRHSQCSDYMKLVVISPAKSNKPIRSASVCVKSAKFPDSRKNNKSSHSVFEAPSLRAHLGMAAAGAPQKDVRSLFENEQHSDVVLLVGNDSNRERIPAHSWVLSSNNCHFQSKLKGLPTGNGGVLELHFKEEMPKAFRCFIKWLYGFGCTPSNTQSALDILQVALKYTSMDLADAIVKYLYQNLDPQNLLQMMTWGFQYTSAHRTNPTAPPSEEEDPPPPYPGEAPPSYESVCPSSPEERDPTNSSQLLVQKWFEVLDTCADQVLASEALEESSFALLNTILSRDTLGVSSEKVVVEALIRWSTSECRRQQQPLNRDSRRQVLGSMLTLPRVLVRQGIPLEILQQLYIETEIQYIIDYLSGEAHCGQVPPTFQGHLETMALPRVATRNPPKTVKRKTKTKSTVKHFLFEVFSAFAHLID